MSEPQTLREYLADFNAYLEVGLRSRRRIFLEVSDHLWQRIERELREGASRAVAERRAITAFGSPEEVARSFQAGLVGALDRRLALSTRRLQVWMAAHRWRAAVTKIALLALVLAVAAAVAALTGARYPLVGVSHWLFIGVVWMVWLSPRAPLRGRHLARIRAWPWRRVKRPAAEPPARTRGYSLETCTLLAVCPYPVVLAWLTIVDGKPYEPFWQLLVLVLLFLGFQQGVAWATDRAVDRVARRRAPATEDAGRGSWEAEHPWRAAFFDIWSALLASFALVLIYPAPLELRGAFAVFLVAVTALVAVGLCLNRSLQEQGAYARSLE